MSMSPPDFLVARVALSVAALLLTGRVGYWLTAELSKQNSMHTVIFAAVIFGAIGSLWVAAMLWVANREPKTQATDEKPPTLMDLFKKDFPYTTKYTGDRFGIQWKNGTVTPVTVQNYLDFSAKTEFVGFYVPRSEHTVSICLRLAENVQTALDDLRKGVKVEAGDVGGVNTLDDLTFSGRVFIYHEDALTNPQKATIVLAFTGRHYDVQLRGPDYLGPEVVAWHRTHDAKAGGK